jgi:hypothetical protein
MCIDDGRNDPLQPAITKVADPNIANVVDGADFVRHGFVKTFLVII